jgi:hypothetical protein
VGCLEGGWYVVVRCLHERGDRGASLLPLPREVGISMAPGFSVRLPSVEVEAMLAAQQGEGAENCPAVAVLWASQKIGRVCMDVLARRVAGGAERRKACNWKEGSQTGRQKSD